MIVRQVDEDELRRMVERNPQRMDDYRKYQEIVAAYNREKDRATVEQVCAELVALAQSLDAEERRAVEEVACGEKVLSNVVSNDTTRGSSRSP